MDKEVKDKLSDGQTQEAPTGTMKPGDQAPPGTPGTGEDICPKCAGKGQFQGKTCENCGGTGKVVKGIGGG
jgi:DnaJ-class molecular chaperone